MKVPPPESTTSTSLDFNPVEGSREYPTKQVGVLHRRIALRGCDENFLFQGRPAARTLLFHFGLKGRRVHGEPALGRQQLRHVEREAVGVVERKGIHARKRTPGRMQVLFARKKKLVKHIESPVQGPPEALLLAPDDPAEDVLPLLDLGKHPPSDPTTGPTSCSKNPFWRPSFFP